MSAAGQGWSAAVDFGGTLTDVVLRPRGADGAALDRLRARPSRAPGSEGITGILESALGPALAESGLEPSDLLSVAVTGGRSAELAGSWRAVPVVRVGETEAIARGGLESGAVTPTLVASLGTGTALVLADPPAPPRHLVGSAIGGGTLLGLARLLVGPLDVVELDALASRGDPGACDLCVGDILGGGIGAIPPEATAAHFGRIGRPGEPSGDLRPEDVAAALVNLVAQSVARLAIEVAAHHRVRSVCLVGHLLDVGGFRDAIGRIPLLDPSLVRIAADPGFAIARGALVEARDRALGEAPGV